MLEFVTGAGCNVMPLYMYKSLFGDKELMPTPLQIFGYGESPIAKQLPSTPAIRSHRWQPVRLRTLEDTLSQVHVEQQRNFDLPVVTPPALTRVPQVHKSVNALRSNLDEVKTASCKLMNDAVNLNEKKTLFTKEYVLSEFYDVLEGTGKLPGGKYHIKLKPDGQPVQHPPRAVPEKKKKAHEDELEKIMRLA